MNNISEMNLSEWVEPCVLTAADYSNAAVVDMPPKQSTVEAVKREVPIPAVAQRERVTGSIDNSEHKRSEFSKQSTSGVKGGGLDLGSMLSGMSFDNPLFKMLIGMVTGGDASSFGESGKGGFDLMSLLPLVMNSGMADKLGGIMNGFGRGSVNSKVSNNKVINLVDYDVR